jgi:FkbM family methyltransferase
VHFSRRLIRSLEYRLFKYDYVPIFARKSLQSGANKLLNLSLRLLGFNNFGPAEKSGERFFLESFFKTDPILCVDVGANVGKYSEFILENSTSQVIAFEPLPGAYKKLQLLQNRFKLRFVIENMGCAEKSGELKLYYGTDSSELASFSNEVNGIDYVGASNINQMLVSTTSLDDYFVSKPAIPGGRCDLLKIDTEGYEYEVLLGSRKFIEKFRPRVIQIEFNLHHLFRGHSIKLISELLTDYKLFRMLPKENGLVPCDSNSFTSNIFSYSNYIFLANESLKDSKFMKSLGI